MKKDGHPNLREVLFEDLSTGSIFIILSTVKTKENKVYEGVEYPWFKVEISSESHPVYTGANNKVIDTAGRVEKFKNRYAQYQTL